MRKSVALGTVLLAVGIGSGIATVDAAEHGAPGLTAASGLLSGACTALGVTSVIVGWATRRSAGNSER